MSTARDPFIDKTRVEFGPAVGMRTPAAGNAPWLTLSVNGFPKGGWNHLGVGGEQPKSEVSPKSLKWIYER